MPNSPEIRDTKKTNLSSLYMIRELGGDLEAAIVQSEASMEQEDVASVMKKFEEWKKKR